MSYEPCMASEELGTTSVNESNVLTTPDPKSAVSDERLFEELLCQAAGLQGRPSDGRNTGSSASQDNSWKTGSGRQRD